MLFVSIKHDLHPQMTIFNTVITFVSQCKAMPHLYLILYIFTTILVTNVVLPNQMLHSKMSANEKQCHITVYIITQHIAGYRVTKCSVIQSDVTLYQVHWKGSHIVICKLLMKMPKKSIFHRTQSIHIP